jgi:glutamate racemase
MDGSQSRRPSSAIGIFDSGVGGLTVVQALRNQLPNETLCYFGDTARVPYGTKSAETVKRYSVEIARFLKTHDVKMIVVACNTASSCALDEIRQVFKGPVIGVVEPGVRAAVRTTQRGRIGLIGTRSTVKSAAYQRLLLQENPALHIASQACPLFVSLVEEGWEEEEITYQIAKKYLTPLLEEQIDVVILGCTHYPLMTGVIQRVFGNDVVLVNSAEEVAKEVERTLREHHLCAPHKIYLDLFYASDDIASFKMLYQRIFGDEKGSFVEAPSDFFQLVQEIDQFKGKIFTESLQWFSPVNK